jgi:hypothetical protein
MTSPVAFETVTDAVPELLVADVKAGAACCTPVKEIDPAEMAVLAEGVTTMDPLLVGVGDSRYQMSVRLALLPVAMLPPCVSAVPP